MSQPARKRKIQQVLTNGDQMDDNSKSTQAVKIRKNDSKGMDNIY